MKEETRKLLEKGEQLGPAYWLCVARDAPSQNPELLRIQKPATKARSRQGGNCCA